MAVVPPMSNDSTWSRPSRRPTSAAAITPAAGPDSTAIAGMRRPSATREDAAAAAHDIRRGQAHAGHRRLEAREIRGQDGPDIGAHRGRARALELADLRQHLARQEDRQVGQRRPAAAPPIARSWASFRNEYSRHTATAWTSWRLMKSTASSSSSSRSGSTTAPWASTRSVTSRRQVTGHEDGGRVLEQIVQARPRRAPQLEHVAHPARGDERDARALALEQRVGDDGGRVREPRRRRRPRCRGSPWPRRGRRARPGRNRAASSAP